MPRKALAAVGLSVLLAIIAGCASPTPTPEPTVAPLPTSAPTATPTSALTATPQPTSTPIPMPTATPTLEPTSTPTATPTPRPTPTPTPRPRMSPNPVPIPRPTVVPRPTIVPRLTIIPRVTVVPITPVPSPNSEVLRTAREWREWFRQRWQSERAGIHPAIDGPVYAYEEALIHDIVRARVIWIYTEALRAALVECANADCWSNRLAEVIKLSDRLNSHLRFLLDRLDEDSDYQAGWDEAAAIPVEYGAPEWPRLQRAYESVNDATLDSLEAHGLLLRAYASLISECLESECLSDRAASAVWSPARDLVDDAYLNEQAALQELTIAIDEVRRAMDGWDDQA